MAELSEHKVEEAYDAPAQRLADKVASLSGSSDARKAAINDLSLLTEELGYQPVSGDCRRIGLQRIGQACRIDVPEGQRGRFAAFSGKRVHVICLGYADKNPQYSERKYLVKILD